MFPAFLILLGSCCVALVCFNNSIEQAHPDPTGAGPSTHKIYLFIVSGLIKLAVCVAKPLHRRGLGRPPLPLLLTDTLKDIIITHIPVFMNFAISYGLFNSTAGFINMQAIIELAVV